MTDERHETALPGAKRSRWRLVSYCIAAAALVLPGRVLAEHGAVSAEIGAGAEGMFVPAPYTLNARPTPGMVPAVFLGGRYALTNSLEVSLGGFFAFPLTYWHNVPTVTADGTFPGSLSHQLMTFGGAVGARYVRGEEVRFIVGGEVGWVHRAYSQFTAWDDTNPANVQPWSPQPSLPNVGVDSFLLAPMVGIEWAAGDHYSFSLLPRLQLLVGPQTTVGVMLPFTFSWSWYL